MPSRRTYLAGVSAALVGLAGCSSGAGSSDPTETVTTTIPTLPAEWGETRTVAGVHVTPTNAAVQHTAFEYVTPDTLGVTGFENQRAVFVTVETSGGALEPSDFELAVPEWREGWVEAPNDQWLRKTTENPFGGTGGGWVGFTAPKLDEKNSELRVEHEGEAAKWTLPEPVLESIGGAAPEFAVEDVSVPDSVAADEMFDVSVTATNTSDVLGTFCAALNELGPSYRPHRITMPLKCDETATWEQSFSAAEAGTEHRFGFRTVDEKREYTVEVTE